MSAFQPPFLHCGSQVWRGALGACNPLCSYCVGETQIPPWSLHLGRWTRSVYERHSDGVDTHLFASQGCHPCSGCLWVWWEWWPWAHQPSSWGCALAKRRMENTGKPHDWAPWVVIHSVPPWAPVLDVALDGAPIPLEEWPLVWPQSH